MKYKIELTQNFYPDRRNFLTPGPYRVPEDISEAIAERALSEGAAKRLEVSKPKTTFPAAKAIVAAPENKARVGWSMRGGGNGSVSDATSGGSGSGPKGSGSK